MPKLYKEIDMVVLRIIVAAAIVINVGVWTGASVKVASSILNPPDPIIRHFDNGARFVIWTDGSQEFLPGRNNPVEFLPSDDPRLAQ